MKLDHSGFCALPHHSQPEERYKHFVFIILPQRIGNGKQQRQELRILLSTFSPRTLKGPLAAIISYRVTPRVK